ncbi:MAG TPA: SRPBCC family protein [Solirubrobacteraceae bacterium]|nr:SRPBCC family protein [Solirubrobacteraceae bacterium]
MKELHGSAYSAVDAPVDQCVALLEAVDRYPEWHPDVVREVEVLARSDAGNPTRVRTKLHVARGPLVKDFNLVMSVASDGARQVRLTKVLDAHSGPEQFEVTWLVEDTGPTVVRLDLSASLDVPRFLPVGGVGDGLAEGFVAAAVKELKGS